MHAYAVHYMTKKIHFTIQRKKKKKSEYENNNQNVALTSPSGHLPSPTISLIIIILKHFIEENSLGDSS